MTHGKSKAVFGAGEKEVIIISLGYGKNQGVAHRGKSASDVSSLTSDTPEWYKGGIESALLAPTAINQQKFRFERNGNRVTAKAGLIGTCLKIDLGIVKCYFEIGAGKVLCHIHSCLVSDLLAQVRIVLQPPQCIRCK